jgi:thioesterase domain-containing protein/acyl carrier protein
MNNPMLHSARTPVEKVLADIWGKALELSQIGLQDDFFHLGGDSLAAAQILAAIQERFGQKLPLSVFFQAPTIEALAMHLDQRPSWSSWSILEPLQPNGARYPFFCVHGVGGCVLNFADLARHFPPEQPFYGIRAASLRNYQQPFASIKDMAAHYVQEIRTVQPYGPFYLGGFSFGGSVALEMAQQLHHQGERVALLAILDHTPPPLRYRRFVWTPTLPLDLIVNAAGWLVEEFWRVGRGKRWTALRRKTTQAGSQFLRIFRRSTGNSGKTDAESVFGGETVPESFRGLVESHYQILRDYVPQRYPGAVTLFRAKSRPLLRLHGKDLGWRDLAEGGLKIISVPGNHETMLREPNVQLLAKSLLALLKDEKKRTHRSGEDSQERKALCSAK